MIRARNIRDFRIRIALASITIAMLVGVTLTASTLLRENRRGEQSLSLLGKQLVTALSRSSVVGVLAADRDQVNRIAGALFEVPDVSRVIIFREGEVFISLDRSPTPLPPPPVPPANDSVEPRQVPDATTGGISFLAPIVLESSPGTAALGIQSGREVVGIAQVTLSRDRIAQTKRSTMIRTAIVLPLAIGLALIASVLVARRIGRPLEKLAAAAEQIGAGELSVVVPVESNDQIGRLSETFNRMVADLRELEESKTKFLALVSHELRTPLVPMRTYLQLARGGQLGPIPEPLQKPIEVMDRAAARLAEHVDSLLLVSVMAAGKLPIAHIPCDLREPVHEAVERSRARMAELNQVLEADLGEQRLPVLGDPVRLAQVFDNLLSNASKFSPKGATIRVRTERTATHVAVEVSDEGIGIDEDLQEKIFQRFYQIHAVVTRPYAGVGLGLAIVRELVTRQGGVISLRSKPGVGSTFRVELPLRVETD